MKVLKVLQLNDDGSVQFEGHLGPNETQYVIEQGLNVILQSGAEAIEELLNQPIEDDEDEYDENPPARH